MGERAASMGDVWGRFGLREAVSDPLFRVKGASRPQDYTLDPEKKIETGWLWPNGRVCHSA